MTIRTTLARHLLTAACLMSIASPTQISFAQTEVAPAESPAVEGVDSNTARDEKLSAALKSTIWTGSFTVDGKDRKLHEESYEIANATPTDNGDYWIITASIKYGDRNITLPVPMQMKWAGDTPVLTCDQLFLPPLGTFDARVLIHAGHYAGTWKHGDKGGHLFGIIEKKPADATDETEAATE